MEKDFIKNIASTGAKKPMICPRTQLCLLGLITVLYTIILVSYFGLRSDFKTIILEPIFLIEIGLVLATSICAGTYANFLSLPDINQKRSIRNLPFIFLALLSAIVFYQHMLTHDLHLEQLCGMENYRCARAVILFSIVPSIIFFITLYNGATTNYILSGLMIGLCAGSFSYFLLRIIHATQNISHLFIWHSLPILFLVILSVLIARFVVPRL